MKLKKLISLSFAAIMAVSLVACGDDGAYLKQLKSDFENYEGHCTLGEYKGFEVTVDKSDYIVTDDMVNSQLNIYLSSYGTTEDVTSGVTANGDDIILDYSGKLDGVAFSGGTATDASYTVGSGQFISDLDQGLAGLTIGESYDIPVRFPDNYQSTELAGKDVIFTVVVKKIVKTIPAVLDDALATQIGSDFSYANVATAAQLKDAIKNKLTTSAEEQYNALALNTVWDKIIGNATIGSYDEAEVSKIKDNITANVQTEYTNYGTMYGIASVDEWWSQMYGCNTADEKEAYIKSYVESYLDYKMTLTLIAKRENIKITQDDIKKYGDEHASEYGFENYDEMFKKYGDEVDIEFGTTLLAEKVDEFVKNNVTIKN